MTDVTAATMGGKMLGEVASSVHIGERARATGLAIAAMAAILALCAWAPSAARASGCTNTWTNTKGGSWFEKENWSKKAVPTGEEEACITESGTYTVKMSQEASTVSVKSLTVGGASGTQTLIVGSTCSLNAVLATSAGISNGAQGAITLTNGDGCGNGVTVTGPIANAGAITIETDHGGARTLQGSLTNTGMLAIDAGTVYDAASTLLTNEGTISLAEGKQLTAEKGASVTNGAGGKVVATGSGDLLETGSGGTFTEGAGTTSGSLPVIVDDAALDYTGAGAGPIALRGTSSLAGASSAGQSLLLQSTCGENAIVTAASGFTSGGPTTLTNGDGCGNNVTLDVSGGVLANSGTLTSEKDNGGARTLQGEVTNTGTLAIDANTAYDLGATTLTNEGTLEVAAGFVLTAEKGASVTNGAGGKIVGAGSGYVSEIGAGGTFTQGAGTTSGSLPVIVDDAALDYTGAGAGPIALRGTSSLTGSLSSGQTLAIQSTCGENATVTAAASFASAGSITLTNGDGCGNNATLDTSSGTLTNSGTLTSEADHGGARTLQGNITNTGTIAIDANTSFNAIEATLANRGTIEIASGVTLSAPAKETIDNEGGTIAGVGTGTLLQDGGTFDEGAGKTTGTEPVILEEVNLHYTGSGASTIAARRYSTFSGNPAEGQLLAIQSTCGGDANVTAVSGFVNSGTIEETNGDGCGNNVTLKLAEGTLENKGTIEIEAAHGGFRAIEGAVNNEKTVVLGAGATLKVVGTYTQGKKGTLEVAIDSASSYGALSVSGATTAGGTLSLLVLKTFKATLGQKYAVLTTSSLSGTFTKEKKATIKKGVPEGLYFRPVYAAGGVTLEVAPITLAPSKAEGAPGSSVTLSGSAYPPEDTVTLTFTDHAKAKTTLPSVKTSAGGTFSTEFTIPAGAAAGTATFEAKSKETGAKVKATFAVT